MTGVVHAVTGTFGTIIAKVSLNATCTSRKQSVSTMSKNRINISTLVITHYSIIWLRFDRGFRLYIVYISFF